MDGATRQPSEIAAGRRVSRRAVDILRPGRSASGCFQETRLPEGAAFLPQSTRAVARFMGRTGDTRDLSPVLNSCSTVSQAGDIPRTGAAACRSAELAARVNRGVDEAPADP